MDSTLYVTDLDGTLLQNDKTVSPYTVEKLNDFLARGGMFTYATARSHVTASRIMQDVRLTLPAITFNGTFIVNARTGRRHAQCILDKDEARGMLDALIAQGTLPMAYAIIDGRERVSYLRGEESYGVKLYVDDHKDDERMRPIDDPSQLLEGEVYYLTMIDTTPRIDAVEPLCQGRPGLRSHKLEDSYVPGNSWLEVSHADSGKEKAVLRLKEMLGVKRVVCFGDNLNDLGMFAVCDEGYAPVNALPAVKEIATGIIESNENDGVARFIDKVR